MLLNLAMGLLASLVLQQTDTTVSVGAAPRLELDNFDGTVAVTTWNRNEVRVRATHGPRDEVEVETSGNVVSIRARGRRGPSNVDYEVTVPVAASLTVSAQSGDVSVEGTRGGVSVETVEGNISVKDGGGFVSLHSVEGEITLEGAHGRIDLNTVEGNIRVTGSVGSIHAESVDGEITLEDIESADVEASSVDGALSYRGLIREGGSYRFTSHAGDVSLSVPDLDATVSVSTFSGSFESDFPVTLGKTSGGRRLNFTLGSGKARVELESFDGSIELRRVGARDK